MKQPIPQTQYEYSFKYCSCGFHWYHTIPFLLILPLGPNRIQGKKFKSEDTVLPILSPE